ncbi:zinc finger protein 93-like isoform X2 [Corythoichthys intestinalis]|nr:zinc finger protein 93-like isoform X2 [Corythoichthys intestinalis]
MWQILKKQDVLSYWEVADFVSLVVENVPALLVDKHRMQLNLGLRARYILELCQNKQPLECDVISSLLDKIKQQNTALEDTNEQEAAIIRFSELIQFLLRDPEARQHFFAEVFPAQYGHEYDSDLQSLFWEFVCRLAQFFPVPDLKQTVCWLETSQWNDSLHSQTEATDLKVLLQHHKHLRHLEPHVPASNMGDKIISTLSVFPGEAEEKPNQLSLGDSHIHEPAVDDATIEIIAEVEVELEENNEMMEGNASVLLEDDGIVEQTEETSASVQPRSSSGPHDCPDCAKKFKFASSLTAHRVVHTGERPHRCADCGRRFSFRQALERHRNTHKSGAGYDCVICGETFESSSARAEHKQTHSVDGVYACPQCERKFTREPALSRHLKTHAVTSAQSVGDAAAEVRKTPDLECVNVRTSRRKRKPTMKVQVIHLQKRKKGKIKQEAVEEQPPPLNCLPLSCSEHSYGSVSISTKDDESCVAGSIECSIHHTEKQQHAENICSDDNQVTPCDEDGGFTCGDCGKSFKFLSLFKSHRRIHTGEQPFLCSPCGRRFSFKQSLERHRQTHKPGRTYDCVICGELCETLVALRSHVRAHTVNGEFACSECGRKFAWKSALVRHLKTHEPAERLLKCPQCELTFSCASYLSRHLQTHREERAYACSCGKSFTYRAALKAHQRIHQKDRPHVCAQCGKGFLYKGGLQNHMKIHSSEMPFMCSFCGKCFKRERNMKKHERCHTRENVYSCSQCEKSFVYKATLIRHELTHSGERPYLCSTCGKGFFSHAELLKHERFHTGHKPFQCPHCDKKFTQSCYLTIHLRYHSGVRPYSCAQCDKSFLSASRLKRHTRTHTGEKPFRCGDCGKGFRQSYHLKVHQRTHKIT